MCCMAVVCLSACDRKEDKYWIESYNKIQPFMDDAENQTYMTSAPIAYILEKNNAQTNLRNIFQGEYKNLLQIYEGILDCNFNMFSRLYGTTQVAPQDAKNSKKYFVKLDKDFEQFKKDLEEFKKSKTIFINSLDIASLDSNINRQILKEYKREYKKFLNQATVLADAFYDLYQNVYFNAPPESVAVSQFSFNALKYKISSIFTKAQIAFLEECGMDNEATNGYIFITKANDVNNSIDTETDLSYTNYKKYADYYELLQVEYNQFLLAIDSIDYIECKADTATYFNNHSNAKVCYEKIEYFKQMNAFAF